MGTICTCGHRMGRVAMKECQGLSSLRLVVEIGSSELTLWAIYPFEANHFEMGVWGVLDVQASEICAQSVCSPFVNLENE